MTDLEDLIRDTFAQRGRAVTAAKDLATAAQTRATRQRRQLTAMGAAAVALTLVVVGIGWATVRTPSQVVPIDKETAAPTFGADWTWLSSSGLEVPIPKNWTPGDSTCIGSTFYGPRVACDMSKDLWHRPLAQIGTMSEEKAPPKGKPIEVDGREATLATSDLENDLTQAVLRFRSPERTVIVRAKDATLIDHMINGVRFVATDYAGCATGAPPQPNTRPIVERKDAFEQILPGTPRVIALCNYGAKHLRGSALLSGQNTAKLIDALRKAPAGPNRDDPDGCAQAAFPPTPVVVEARYEIEPPVRIHITYEGCVGRRIDNGGRIVQVTETVVHEVVVGLGTPMGYHADLPK